MAKDTGVNPEASTVEKVSKFESPEKWAAFNPYFAPSSTMVRGVRNNLSLLALRVLLDAFLYKLGHRPVEWTEDEVSQWEQKKKAAGQTRSELIKTSKGHLIACGFVEPELRALFSANNRTTMNAAAHEMEIKVMVDALQYLQVAATSRSAIEKAFAYVCQMEMKDVDPNSTDVVTTTGLAHRPTQHEWLFEEEVGGWD